MRRDCLEEVFELAKKDDRVYFIGSDLGVGTLNQFKREIPERFLMEGISEANIIGMAAGLAMEGKIVYVNTIATFITRRCFEQIALDLCLQNLNVRLIGNGGGLVYAPLGPTHLAIEDMAILRALPNAAIVAPADAAEMRRFMPESLNHRGPLYIRLGKGNEPVITNADDPFRIGKVFEMQTGAGQVALLTTGVALHPVLHAAGLLKEQGVDATVLHIPTVKPLDVSAVESAIQNHEVVLTVEEHTIIGGLGSAVAELIAEGSYAPRFRRIGVPDEFPRIYGSQADQLEHYGISGPSIAAHALELAGAGATR